MKITRFVSIILLISATVWFGGCQDEVNNPGAGSGLPSNVLYIENDLPIDNQNAVLAYRRAVDGTLAPLAGSPFLTGGKGVDNSGQKLGSDDTDESIVLSEDRKRLFAVNSGSNTIAVFTVNADGSLTAVPGSPFPSGGINPVSVNVAGNYLYVVNKNDDPGQVNTNVPNYTVFSIAGDGALAPVPNSTIQTIAGASPAHALVAPGKKLLFIDDFLAFMAPTPAGTLRAFTIGPDGKLTATPGTPVAINGMGGALGLWAHPTANALYVGYPMDGTIGVYSYDPTTGALTFRTKVMAGKAVCWLRINAAGTRLYALVSGENKVAVFDLANPLSPASLQTIELKNSGPMFMAMPNTTFTTSQPFHESLSPDGKFLYVNSQYTNPDLTLTGNYTNIHVLAVDGEGKLSEVGEPTQLPVGNNVRPQGIVVY